LSGSKVWQKAQSVEQFMAGRCMRRTVAWLLAVGTVLTLALPAGAQFFDDRYPFDQRARRSQPQPRQPFMNNFPFFNQGERQSSPPPYRPGFIRPAQPADSSKAPSPHRQDTSPTSTVVVMGDSMADWLGYGLEETLSDTPEIGIVRKIRPSSGLIHYDPRSDTPDWPQALKDLLPSEKPSAIIVMLGLNDRQQSIRERAPQRPAAPQRVQDAQPGQPAQQPTPPDDSQTQPAPNGDQQAGASHDAPRGAAAGASYEFRTDKWAETYAKRIDEIIAALKSRGAPIIWVGLPSIRGQRPTADNSYLDDLFRTRAEKAGIVYIDVWDGFVDESGRFTQQGPDFEGQIRKLRSSDGIHFTKAGAVKLAHYVERDLRRALSRSAMPVALPVPSETAPSQSMPAKPGTSALRPAAGPVVPLTENVGTEGELLGGGGRAAVPSATDPTATRVLVRGESVAAPTGRADDFSWPRRGIISTDSVPDPQVTPATLVPAGPASAKASGADSKKAKADTKKESTPDGAAAPARTHRSPRAELNVPRPPGNIGNIGR
jgi:uncharacterized protein